MIGVSSTYVAYRGLKYIGANVKYKLPHRLKDGYGLSEKLIDYAKELGAKLIITVDNGITAVDAIDKALAYGIDVIVTDHHEPQEVLPRCEIINPKVNLEYPFNGLCGCGVIFKVICALIPNIEETNIYEDLLQIVAIATIADIMELIDENRTIVIDGLKYLNKSPNKGIKYLFIQNEKECKNVTAETVGFFIGPCINAAGRMDSADIALDLYLSDDDYDACRNATKLLNLNNQRKELQEVICNSIDVSSDNDCIIAFTDDKRSAGIVGIIAAKIVSKYNKPCFMLHEGKNGEISGSGRTFSDFEIINCLTEGKHLIIGGGGHKGACGLKLKRENLEEFQQLCNNVYRNWIELNPECRVPTIDITCETSIKNFDVKLVNNISKLEPYSECNPKPVFITKSVNVSEYRIVGKNKDVVQFVFDEGDFFSIKGIGFNEILEKYKKINFSSKVSIIYNISLNEYPAGKFTPQLNIIDIY